MPPRSCFLQQEYGAQVGLDPQIPMFDRVIIDEDADNEKRASRRKTVEELKSQLDFLRKLYLLKETTDSIAERAEVWTKADETSIPFSHRLTRSPLAQRVVRDLIYWAWDAARELWDYTVDADQSAFQLLKDLGSQSLESGRGDPKGQAKNPCTLDLNSLELAARTLSQIVDNVFYNTLFEWLCPETEGALDDITQYLRLLDGKLEEKLYWLGEILEDLGKVMALDGEALSKRGCTKPTTYLNQVRGKRNQNKN